MSRKEPQRSYTAEAKEPAIERIFMLVDRYRSRGEAANAWGINVNTLQNYYKRREQAPVPRRKLLERIAEHEGVSVDWLISGEGHEIKHKKEHERTQYEYKPANETSIETKLLTLLGTLSNDEKQSLFEVLARKGVETALYLLDEDNIKLLQLDRVMKEKILGLQPRAPEEMARATDEARVCDTDNSGQASADSLASEKRQAG